MAGVIRISSPDKEYINKIVGKLASQIKDEIRLEFITENECFVKTHTESPKADYEFIDEAFLDNSIRLKNIENVFIISERAVNGNTVSKLEGSGAIIRVLGEDALKNSYGKRGCKVVNVVSPYGGSGKTVTALSLAISLSQMHRNVLYIDAEYAQNFYEVLPESEYKHDFADIEMASSVINLTTNSYGYIKKQVIHGAFDYIPAFEKHLFTYHIGPETFNKLADSIAARGDYDYIIVEQESSVNPEMLQYLMSADELVFVTNRNIDDSRMRNFLKLFEDYHGFKIIVQTMIEESIPSEIEGIPIAEQVLLEPECNLINLIKRGAYRKAAEAIL